jgi:antigen flippase
MSSHRQIFKSTALIGGAQVINMGIGIVRTKALALVVGPNGRRLSRLYMTVTGVIGSIAGLGFNGSGVRQNRMAAGNLAKII